MRKLYLDDERTTPEGWDRAFTAQECIEAIESGLYDIVSLDHDLGDEASQTGYDVLLWIEEKVFTENWNPPKILIHTANSSARIKMEKAVKAIENKLKGE